MSLLISCKGVGCESFVHIKDLTEDQKEWMKQQSEQNIPRGWIEDIANSKEIYEKNCN